MIKILDLKETCFGRPAAILGGGPSLPLDLKKIPAGALLFSINNHALQLTQADYLVFRDSPEKFPALLEAVKSFKGLRVSQLKRWTDIDLEDVPWWDAPFSSSLATWLACWLGCKPVLLAGMDLYQGKEKYFYDRVGFHLTASQVAPAGPQMRAWEKAKQFCPHAEDIRALSGPLVEVFGGYDE